MNREFDTMKKTLTTGKAETGGYVLILALIVTLALMTIGFSLAQVAATKYASTKKRIYDDTAIYAAEAGISETISQLNDNPNFAGFSTAKTVDSNGTDSRTTFITTVTNGPNSISRYIESTGSVYAPASATTALNTKKVRVLVNKNTSLANYSMFAGPGGVSLGASSNLQAPLTYSRGPISLAANSTYGNSSSTHNAVDTSCTQSGTNMYPSLCPSSQPFTIDSTAVGVVGNACAHKQSPSVKIPNLITGCSPMLAEIQPVNRTSYASGTTASGFSCYSGSRVINANTVYNNLANIGGSCNLTINGNVYVNGNISINGSSAKLIVAESAGDEPPVIMATGYIRLSGMTVQPNSSGTSLRIISVRSNNTNCSSTNPACVALPANGDRQASQILEGITCDDDCQATGAQLMAYFARVTMSGNTLAGSIAGQSISIPSGTATLSGTTQTNRDVLNTKWAVVDYQRKAIP